ncbi:MULTISPECIES: dihydrofolate reductase family protein [unclassified Amycolatopsis]|uniref:dihydrofolate reductase family protein n=1 Tax=unclassified Amycolatopsis TaxID=2618356 RepID=UPI001C699A22|nr:dihydrofolate reductase family protein [Amycolatopsis sp. DSM 110486]QYN25547.1 dihydrofolate reductase family protein [Amycolatopsis sp. DSM 110486]
MSKVITAHAVSVDGYLSGHTPEGQAEFGRGLGDAAMLFDWYSDGDTQSTTFDGFRLSEPSARFFDGLASRLGAAVAGRTTYEHSSHFSGGSPHPTAPLVVVSHHDVPEISEAQTLVTTGIADAIAAGREIAGSKDVGVMGGALASSALAAGLVDEVVLHQVPILLGRGRPFFHELPAHVNLRLIEVVPAPGVTHLHYEVVR